MMKIKYIQIPFISFVIILINGCTASKKDVAQKNNAPILHEYAITPVDIKNVKLNDDFWLPIVKRVQEKTIAYAIHKCEEEGRMFNYLLAGGKVKGEIKGAMPFDDTDLYKIIEGASNTLISSPDAKLETLLDSLIAIISVGQEKDGYLTTWRTVNPAKPPAPWVKVIEGKRWESLEASHELYNAGHMYEAAAVHYRATGKKNFLNIALKNADLMVKTFGDGKGQVKGVPGHQIIETGLLQLFKITKNESYLQLAKYFLDNRGNAKHHKLYGDYSQDHIPVTQQREATGHAVRAMYMYAAMTDIATILDNQQYDVAAKALWKNMTTKKMYVTGGIGSRHDGEAFGVDYELPNLTAYSETCAAIGSIYWNHRLHQQTGDVKYFDIIERTLYNSMIAGISLDGTHFFYPNALESDGVYKFNRGFCTREGWFDCSCCPTNMIRFIPSMSSLIYSKDANSIYVNLLVGSKADISFAGKNIKVSQVASPWKGGSKIDIANPSEKPITLKIRIPHYIRGEAVPGNLYQYKDKNSQSINLIVDGKAMDIKTQDGYMLIDIALKSKHRIEVQFEMQAKTIFANDNVKEDLGKLALECGPFIYAFEEVDNANIFDQLSLQSTTKWNVNWKKNLLHGVNVLSDDKFTAVPYYAWSNRSIGKMKVWIKNSQK